MADKWNTENSEGNHLIQVNLISCSCKNAKASSGWAQKEGSNRCEWKHEPSKSYLH